MFNSEYTRTPTEEALKIGTIPLNMKKKVL